MSKPISPPRNDSGSLVNSGENFVERSSNKTSEVEKLLNSAVTPVMKTKTASSIKQQLSAEKISAMNNQNIHDIREDSKTEISSPQQSNEVKAQWLEFSKKISPNGIIEIKDISLEKIEEIANWLKLSSHRELTGLNIVESIVDESIVVTLNKFIQTHTSITTLEIIGTKMGNVGVKALADGITKSKITTLHLSEVGMGPSGREVLFEAIPNSNITKLNLSGNQFGISFAKGLADMIPKSKIHALDISNNEIGTEGAKILAESLKSNTVVTTLNLSDNDIDAEGVVALADLMKNNTQITRLTLEENNYSKEAEKYVGIINTQCLLNTQKIMTNNISAALDLLTDHPNPIDGNETSVRDVNDLISQKLFALDKADKLNTAEVINDPNSVFSKYT